MKRKRRIPGVAAIGAAAAALVVAGCGGGGYGGGSKTSGAADAPVASKSTEVALRTTSLGKVLVGSRGRTLYLFLKDTGPSSRCDGACASVWPPLTTSGAPKAGAGVDQGKLTTTKRADGKRQVVYHGHPLYYYVSDTQPGDTSGEGLDQFGAEWYAVSPAGQKVEKGAS